MTLWLQREETALPTLWQAAAKKILNGNNFWCYVFVPRENFISCWKTLAYFRLSSRYRRAAR